MGDGIGDTEKVPAAQHGRLAGAIGAAGGQRPDYWGILPQGVREYGEFLPLAGVAAKERQFRYGGGRDRSSFGGQHPSGLASAVLCVPVAAVPGAMDCF